MVTELLASETELLVLLMELQVLLSALRVSERELVFVSVWVTELLASATELRVSVLAPRFGRAGLKHRSTPVVPQGGIPSVAPALTYSFQDSNRV